MVIKIYQAKKSQLHVQFVKFPAQVKQLSEHF